MASIHKRGKRWRVCWRTLDGGQRQRSCPTKASARRLQVEIEEEIALGRDWQSRGLGATPAPALREVVERYVREIVRVHAPATALVTARDLDIWIRWLDTTKDDEESRVDVLSKAMLSDYYDCSEKGRHDRPRKPVTRKKLVHAVERFWRWAYDEDDLGGFVSRPRSLRMPTGPGSPTMAPTWEEMDACVLAAEGPTYQLAVVLRYTGLRVQQVMGLLWSDLDMADRNLVIRGELGKSRQEQQGRIIPVSDSTFSI